MRFVQLLLGFWLVTGLLFASADTVKINVVIETVDDAKRTLTANSGSTQAETITLNLDPNVKVVIDGKLGRLSVLTKGQKAAVAYDTVRNLVMRIEIEVSGSILAPDSRSAVQESDGATAAPVLIPLTELNAQYSETKAWLSPDGLRIYWDVFIRQSNGGGEVSIWTATRKSPNARFEKKRKLLDGGYRMTLRGDELEMLFPIGSKLHTTKRKSIDEPFERPRPINELEKFDFAYACISEDGLTLYATQVVNRITRNCVIEREILESAWKTPKLLYGTEDHNISNPFVCRNGLLVFAYSSDASDRLAVKAFSRESTKEPFTFRGTLEHESQSLKAVSVFYSESTGELFYSGISQDDKNTTDLILMKNFSPSRVIEPPQTK